MHNLPENPNTCDQPMLSSKNSKYTSSTTSSGTSEARPSRPSRPAGDRGDRGDRGDHSGKKEYHHDRGERRDARSDRGRDARPNALSALLDLDRELLRMVARRARMLRELPQGREATRSERDLRAGWESAASRVSRDPRLIRQLFALLQEVECLPRLQDGGSDGEAFSLKPVRRPADFTLSAPVDCRRTRILGAMAAASGSACDLSGVLVNDPLVGLVKGFNQLSPSLRWEEDGRLLCVPERGIVFGGDKALLDRAVHIDDDMLNFLLLLFCMAVRPCRLKIMGKSALKLADFSPLRHFLPSIGARFTSIVPGQDGLPARLEASGILPETVDVPAALDADAVLALCVALACVPREHGVAVRLGAHPKAAEILAELAEIFQSVQSVPFREGTTLHFSAAARPALHMTELPPLPMDLGVAAIVLSVPVFTGGVARVNGLWPDNAAGKAAWNLLESAGLTLRADGLQIIGERAVTEDNGASAAFFLAEEEGKALDPAVIPLVTAFAARAALANGQAELPACVQREDLAAVDEFLSRLGLERSDMHLRPGEAGGDVPWGSPTFAWAVTLALAAFMRPGLQLLNPGIVTDHMPGFWQWYNGLPCPALVRPTVVKPEPEARPVRRRIRAGYMPEDQMPEPLAAED